jgi:threonine dehydrogenase-like Zn-dependent dehydrogenase
LGKKVFSFQPHVSHFCASAGQLVELPPDLPLERGVFLPNMETALNFVMDAQPIVGEFAGIWGLGVVGLLTAALLKRFPLGGLVGWDRYAARRQAGLSLGLEYALDPGDDASWQNAQGSLRRSGLADGLDLAIECSGAPQALNQAVSLLGFGSRLVIGSWYGTKPVQLDLGGSFHRSRIEMIASQVSTIAPSLRGRWDKPRRFAQALRLLGQIQPETWITQRYPLSHAAEAFRQLCDDPSSSLQVVFTY